MRDEANNFVMGLLFLSGDWWEGSGGPGPEPRRPGRLETGARLLLGNPLELHGQVLTLPVLRRAASDQPPSARLQLLMLPPAASSFLPSVKFPVTSMGFHVQHTCDRGTPGRHQGAGLGSVRALPTWFAVWKAPPGIKFMFLILVRWSGWEPRTHSWELQEVIRELTQRVCPEGRASGVDGEEMLEKTTRSAFAFMSGCCALKK